MDDDLVFVCPACAGCILVRRVDLNCHIFRHAVLKANMLPIHPHAPREMCEKLVADGLVYGCGAPFRVVPVSPDDATLTAVSCEYI